MEELSSSSLCSSLPLLCDPGGRTEGPKSEQQKLWWVSCGLLEATCMYACVSNVCVMCMCANYEAAKVMKQANLFVHN